MNRKQKVIGVVIILFVLALIFFGGGKKKADESTIDEMQKNMEAQQEAEEEAEQAILDAQREAEEEDEAMEEYEIIDERQVEYIEEQERLVKRYGEPTEGFRWDDSGELIPLSDASMTAEEVLYAYLRNLSQLSFSDVQKYSYNSKVVRKYLSYYSKDDDLDYMTEYRRRLLKDMLLSFEIEGVTDTVVFAENKVILSVKLKCIDLGYKDFWYDDKETLFNTLLLYRRTEQDGTKADIYLYEYLEKYYEDVDFVQLTEKTLDFTLQKGEKGGWLVTDDNALLNLSVYEEGETIVEYIKECYSDWYDDLVG